MIKVRLAVMNDEACWKPFAYEYTDEILNAEFRAVYVDLELPMSCDSDVKIISRIFDAYTSEDLAYFIENCDNHITLEVDKEEREKAKLENCLEDLHNEMYNEFGNILLDDSEDYFYTRIDNVDTELMMP